MDLFAHTRASGVAQMQLFKSMDIAVGALPHIATCCCNCANPSLVTVTGALSIIPTLCYTFFLYLFAKRNLLPVLSSSWNTLISRTLLVLIPLMVTLNTVSSFLGISYSKFWPWTQVVSALTCGLSHSSGPNARWTCHPRRRLPQHCRSHAMDDRIQPLPSRRHRVSGDPLLPRLSPFLPTREPAGPLIRHIRA